MPLLNFFSSLVLLIFAVSSAEAQSVTRSEALRVAEQYVQHQWRSSSRNVLHGQDKNGVEVHTPDRNGGRAFPPEESWKIGEDNIGVAYKWGGFDTPASFDLGISGGKAAGDVYTAEKRRLDDHGISDAAVGIDCSGFICRCWKLSRHFSTYSLGDICRRLSSPAELEPADIMNAPRGHVLLFVRFLDSGKKRALFYEAAPFSKCVASERDVASMAASGYVPLRYKRIK